jgi:hypothetical protein
MAVRVGKGSSGREEGGAGSLLRDRYDRDSHARVREEVPDQRRRRRPGGRRTPCAQRLPVERRADKYLADLYVYSSSSGYALYQAKVFDPIKPALILPEVLDQSNWWEGKHHYADPESECLLYFDGIFRVSVTTIQIS